LAAIIASYPLNDRFLSVHAARVSVPSYDRRALRPGVVHISVGGFHRSHQAVYFDELARRRPGKGWALTGVGLRRRDMKEALDAQDGLYTVVERGPGGDSARVVGVMTRYLYAPHDRERVLEAIADPSTHLVTLTITANGYEVDQRVHPSASHDPATPPDLANAAEPSSALGLLVEALDRRRRSGNRPITVLSCDNLTGNGAVARNAIVSVAALRDQALADWVDRHVAFPNTMVDRITPYTTCDDRTMVERTFGVQDRWPVITEPFKQWVIEDSFRGERPPLDEVGVQFVSDVRPYALAKTRLLNASHLALGYLGTLAGYRELRETANDATFGGYVSRMMHEEVVPLLPSVGLDLSTYTAGLQERFLNPAIGDRLERLCRNGSTKVPAHLLASIHDAQAKRRPYGLLTLAVAAWCRYLRGVDERGRRIDVDDPRADVLGALARAGGDHPSALLQDHMTFGALGTCPQFAKDVENDLHEIASDGIGAVASRRSLSMAHAAQQ
jgi:fructuronate reductase/mannitol 2-dehydrogenase